MQYMMISGEALIMLCLPPIIMQIALPSVSSPLPTCALDMFVYIRRLPTLHVGC